MPIFRWIEMKIKKKHVFKQILVKLRVGAEYMSRIQTN